MFHLPADILRTIYEFDGTYREKYNDVMDELCIEELFGKIRHKNDKVAQKYIYENYIKKSRKTGGYSISNSWPNIGDNRILESFKINDENICWIWK